MSFGGAGQGNIRYSILLDDTQAVQKIGQFKTALNGITQPSQALATNIGTLNTNFTTISTGLTSTNTGFKTLGTGISGLSTPTQTLNTNMGALSNNFKLLNTTEAQTVTQTNAFKTGITALTAPTATVNTNMKGLVGTMGPLAGNFTKTTGAAKDMVVQQNNLTQSSTSLGSKIKDNVGRFAGFATGMATVATGVIGLVRNIRDLEDSQIAVDITNRRMSLSQEAVDKATKKLAADTIKYGKNSKEVKQDILDLNQATQKHTINIKQNSEALERQSDNLQDVATSGFTTLLGVTTTAISGSRDLGLTIKGGIPKIKEFGTSLKGLGANLLGTSGGFKGVIGNLGALGFAVVGAVGLFEEFNKQLKITQGVVSGSIKPLEGATQTLDRMSSLDFSSIEQAIISIAKLTGGSKALSDILKPEVKRLEDLAKNITELSKANDVLDASIGKVRSANLSRDKSDNQAALTNFLLAKAELLRLKTLEKLPPTIDKTTAATEKLITPTEAWIAGLVKTKIQTIQTLIDLREYARVHGITIPAAIRNDVNAMKDHISTQLHLNATVKDGTKAQADAAAKLQLIVGIQNSVNNIKQRAIEVSQKQIEIENSLMEAAKKSADAIKQRALEVIDLQKRIKDAAEGGLQKLIDAFHKTQKGKLDFEVDFKRANKKLDEFMGNVAEKFDDGGAEGAKKYVEKFIAKAGNKFEGESARIFDPIKEFIEEHADESPDIWMRHFLAFIKDYSPSVFDVLKENQLPTPKDMSKEGTTAGKSYASAFAAAIARERIKLSNIIPPLNSIPSPTQSLAEEKLPPGVNEFTQGGANKRFPKRLPKGRIRPPTVMYGYAPGDIYGDVPVERNRITGGPELTGFGRRGTGQQGAYGGPGSGGGKGGLPVIDQTAFQKGLQLAIANAAQSIQIITQTIAKLASVTLPVISQVVFQKGLQVAINNAAQTVQIISTTLTKVASIAIPAADQSKLYQRGLQLAIENASQTVQFIKAALDKVSSIVIPAADQSKKYQKGLQLAINNAAQTVKLIKKSLDAIAKISVPAPKFNNFNSALDQAVSDTKRAVRDINNALKKINKPSSGGGGNGSGPGATTGPFAHGGSVIANQRTTATFGEAGPELAMFIPLKGRSGVGSSGGGGDTIIENHFSINVMDETIMRRITSRSGKNRFTLGV